MSGEGCWASLRTGPKSVVVSGYFVSETTSRPFFAAFARAPSIGFFENGASAATIATVRRRRRLLRCRARRTLR